MNSVIFFDFDNTIVDSNKFVEDCLKRVLFEFKINTSEAILYYIMNQHYLWKPFIDIFISFWWEEKWQTIYRLFSSFRKNWNTNSLFPWMKELLIELYKENIMILISNNRSLAVKKDLIDNNIINLFSEIICRENVMNERKYFKPSPKMLEIALENFQLCKNTKYFIIWDRWVDIMTLDNFEKKIGINWNKILCKWGENYWTEKLIKGKLEGISYNIALTIKECREIIQDNF